MLVCVCVCVCVSGVNVQLSNPLPLAMLYYLILVSLTPLLFSQSLSPSIALSFPFSDVTLTWHP